MTTKNRCRIAAATIAVALLATVCVALLVWHHIRELEADNKILFEAVVEEDEIIHRKYVTCEQYLADPVVKRIANAGKRGPK